MRLVALILLAVALAPMSLALAQVGPIRLVQGDDGALWAIADGVRPRMSPAPIGVTDLAAIPEGEPWGANMGATSSAAATDRSAVGPTTRVVYEGWELVVISAHRDKSLPESALSNAKQIEAKGIFVNAVLEVKNLGATSASVPQFYQFDEQGRRFDQDGFAGLYGSRKYKTSAPSHVD